MIFQFQKPPVVGKEKLCEWVLYYSPNAIALFEMERLKIYAFLFCLILRLTIH